MNIIAKTLHVGLLIDERFTWGPHIEKVCAKLRAILAKFYLLRYKIPYFVLITMYKALAESLISYGLSSYGRTFKTYIDPIKNLQKRMLKTIVPPKEYIKLKDEGRSVFNYCKIVPIHDKFCMNLLMEQFFRKEILHLVEHPIATRNVTSKKLVTSAYNNYYGKRTSQYLIPRLINNLPITIKSKIQDKNIKEVLKEYFIEKL